MLVVVLGYGYVAKYLATKFNPDFKIYSTSRSITLGAAQIIDNLSIVNFLDPKLENILLEADVILSTIPPVDNYIDPVLEQYKNIIVKSKCSWLGYISATSVYGDHNGAWVTEASNCNPSNLVAMNRLAAEKMWQNISTIQPHIFRVAGIYGPGRNCLERIQQGQGSVVVKKNQIFSRIHIHDLCSSILASINQPTPGEIYNIGDDLPAPNNEVEQFAASLLNLPPLKQIDFLDANISAARKRFFLDNKKVCNKKIKQALSLNWQYPTYKEGLKNGCLPFII